eukprot:g33372.t1
MKTEAAQKKATAEGSLAEAKKSMFEAATALQDLQATCLKKASKFEEDMQAKAEEVKALADAKDAISAKMGGGDVSFLQLGRGTARLPADSERAAAAGAAARSVRRLAVKLDSPSRLGQTAPDGLRIEVGFPEEMLVELAGRLIEGMIEHLQSEARAEADHQAFCDKEMSVTGVKSADKQEDVDKLGTKIEQAKAQAAHLTELTNTLRQELADLAKTQLEMEEVRQKEKALADKAQLHAKEGMEGLRTALQVLRTYYARIGDPVGRGKQVVSMLEYAKSDIHRRVTVLESEEKLAVSEYEKISKDNAVMSATKQHEVDSNTADLTELKKMLNELNSDHTAATEELEALQDWGACVIRVALARAFSARNASRAAERKEKREKEIQGLKEALGALDGSQLQMAEAPIHNVFLQLRGASSSEGPTILLEQSPARSKAPSDGPSEFSSWHDDASSSLAPSGTARDGTITVNPLVMRMGEHLKGKLQGMIRQRFENYLHIIKTLQNDIGKLAALTCELRMADRHRSSAAAGLGAQNAVRYQDGTFVVYAVPDAAGVLGSQCSSPASSEDKASHLEPSERSSEALPSREDSRIAEPSDVMSQWVHKAIKSHLDYVDSPTLSNLTGLRIWHEWTLSQPHCPLSLWVHDVEAVSCLPMAESSVCNPCGTRLMHGTQSAWGMESVEDVSPGHIAEDIWGSFAIELAQIHPVSTCVHTTCAHRRRKGNSRRHLEMNCRLLKGATGDVLVPEESSGIVCELLCVRASAYAQMQQYADALVDAETVSGIQPTCASGSWDADGESFSY